MIPTLQLFLSRALRWWGCGGWGGGGWEGGGENVDAAARLLMVEDKQEEEKQRQDLGQDTVQGHKAMPPAP